MTGLDELRITFFQECEDLLEQLGNGLRVLADESGEQQVEIIHSVFRTVHSIKGGAGAFALGELVEFSHLFETVLDQLRSGQTAVTPSLVDTLLRAGDILDDLVHAARDETASPDVRLARIVAELDALVGGADDGFPGDPLDDFEFEPVTLQFDDGPRDPAPEATLETGERIFDIHLAPQAEMYMSGNEPAALFTALAELGEICVTAEAGKVQPLASFDYADPQLFWHARLTTDANIDEVAAIFDFVEDIAEIHITPRTESSDRLAQAGRTAGAAPIAAEQTSVAGHDADVLPLKAEPSAHSGQVGADTTAGVRANAATPKPAPATVRVDLGRVDRLINLVGELVTMEAVLSRIISDTGLGSNTDAVNGMDRIRHLADDIQEGVMAIRAQPLRPVFQRMERILREATEATGKKARLVTQGAETEVDKTVIERLVDPLTHMIRNSVDHGLEEPAIRIAAGKPETGTITLAAAHRSGRVLIEVSDDGAGIDRARVRQIAEEKQLVRPDATLTPPEIDAILFMPGFSSRSNVSAVSGRGVGLDVVQREIQALGGHVTIASSEGGGTVFTIALPLTLAVLEGMLIEFGGQTMVVPLASVSETLSTASATIHAMGATGRMIADHGQPIPVIDLAEKFQLPAQDLNDSPGVFVVLERSDGLRAALTAERILDQRQVVIKSLEENYGPVPGISAATILGDGRIALILDPESILQSTRPNGAGMMDMAGGMP